MGSLLTRWVILTVAILIAASVIPGIKVDSLLTAFLAAVVLSLLNAFVRPILVILTLPINVLTLGLFLLVINAVLLGLVAGLMKGVHVSGFGAAFLGALVISVISTLLNFLFRDAEKKQ